MQSAKVPRLAGYEPAFDGLRALAVTTVLAYHASERLLPGGWMGVDVFFVLSGYLITSLLNREMVLSGTVDLKKFYMRRVLRLTPAFWVLLAAIAVMVAAFSVNRAAGLNAIWISGLYLMNWNRAFDLAPQGLLGHTWSLAMEEQFYLLWPAALLFIIRRQPVRWIAAVIAAITSWRIFLALSGADPERTYNGFDTHGDALLIGCALALLPIDVQSAARARALAAIPATGAILMLAEATHRTLFTQTIGITFASVLSAWLVIGASQPGWLRQFLSVRPLVYTGRISYGWYLWHYPVLLLGEKVPPLQGGWGKAVLILTAYAVAACSYRFVEQPFLRLKAHFEPKETKLPTRSKAEESVPAAAHVAS